MKEAHEALYAAIPGFQCLPECTACCGPMPFHTGWEWERLEDKKLAIGASCPYKGKNGCTNYEQRFFLCRLHGSLEGLECPKGTGPNKLLSKAEGKALLEKYYELT